MPPVRPPSFTDWSSVKSFRAFPPLVSMSKVLNTRRLNLQCGMSAVKIRSDSYGDTTSKVPKVSFSSLTLLIRNVSKLPRKNYKECSLKTTSRKLLSLSSPTSKIWVSWTSPKSPKSSDLPTSEDVNGSSKVPALSVVKVCSKVSTGSPRLSPERNERSNLL